MKDTITTMAELQIIPIYKLLIYFDSHSQEYSVTVASGFGALFFIILTKWCSTLGKIHLRRKRRKSLMPVLNNKPRLLNE